MPDDGPKQNLTGSRKDLLDKGLSLNAVRVIEGKDIPLNQLRASDFKTIRDNAPNILIRKRFARLVM